MHARTLALLTLLIAAHAQVGNRVRDAVSNARNGGSDASPSPASSPSSSPSLGSRVGTQQVTPGNVGCFFDIDGTVREATDAGNESPPGSKRCGYGHAADMKHPAFDIAKACLERNHVIGFASLEVRVCVCVCVIALLAQLPRHAALPHPPYVTAAGGGGGYASGANAVMVTPLEWELIGSHDVFAPR